MDDLNVMLAKKNMELKQLLREEQLKNEKLSDTLFKLQRYAVSESHINELYNEFKKKYPQKEHFENFIYGLVHKCCEKDINLDDLKDIVQALRIMDSYDEQFAYRNVF